MTHIPVLLNEVITALNPKSDEIYVDATFGGGGYTRAILNAAPCSVIAIDRDDCAIERAQNLRTELTLTGRDASWQSQTTIPPATPLHSPALHIAHGPFSELESYLDQMHIPCVDAVILDLGVSSFHLDEADRGFSFRFDAPLSMTMGCNAYTAYDVVNDLSEEELARIFWEGEEKFGRRIAKKIVTTRATKPIQTTYELAHLIASCKPKRYDGVHPATLGFQAIRIYVNEELTELKNVLNSCKNRLKAGGRLIVVTFHSLEDRIVKQFMRRESGYVPRPSRHDPCEPHVAPVFFTMHPKKAIASSPQEQQHNPRARSAKLRVAHRTDMHACERAMEYTA